MDEIEVSTVVYVPPEEAFEFLMDFPGYTSFTEYLEEVRQDGDGGVGTRYDFVLSWWKLSYTATSEVTAVDPPGRIDWRLVGSLDAEGSWLLEEVPEEVPVGEGTPANEGVPAEEGTRADEGTTDGEVAEVGGGEETATRVRLRARYDTDSLESAPLDLPRFISTDAVVDKVKPVVLDELGAVVQHIVAELEGERRSVDVYVETGPAVAGDESAA